MAVVGISPARLRHRPPPLPSPHGDIDEYLCLHDNKKIFAWYRLDALEDSLWLAYQPANTLNENTLEADDRDIQKIIDYARYLGTSDGRTAYISSTERQQKSQQPTAPSPTKSLTETVTLNIVNHYDVRTTAATMKYSSKNAFSPHLPREITALLRMLKKTYQENDVIAALGQWAVALFNDYHRVHQLAIDIRLEKQSNLSLRFIPSVTILTVDNDETQNRNLTDSITAYISREALVDQGELAGHHVVATFTKGSTSSIRMPVRVSVRTPVQKPVQTPVRGHTPAAPLFSYEEIRKKFNAQENEGFLRLLACDPVLVQKYDKFIDTIKKVFFTTYRVQQQLSAYELRYRKHSPHSGLLRKRDVATLVWPDELPKNNRLYEHFWTFKKEVAVCQSCPGWESISAQDKKMMEAFQTFCKNALSDEHYHIAMKDAIAAKVSYAQEVYKKALQSPSTKNETTQNPQQRNNTSNQRDVTQTAEALGGKQTLVNPHYITWSPLKWEQFYQYYNEFGIARKWERDHYWKKLPPTTLNFFRTQLRSDVKNYDNLPELIELNKVTLEPRYCIKEDLADSIGAPPEAKRPMHIDELLYKLVDRCQEQANIPDILKELSHLTLDSDDQQNRQLCQLFFEANGICKFVGMPESRKILMRDITIDTRIHHAANLKMRGLLNYFVALPLETPEKIEWVRRGIQYCLKACEPGKVGKAYQQLATVQFEAYLNQTHRLILHCGNFAQELGTPEQRNVQKNITLHAARLISSSAYIDEDTQHMLKIAIVEAARQLNGEGKPESATQALDLLDYYERMEYEEADNDHSRKMHAKAPQLALNIQEGYNGRVFERTCSYKLDNLYDNQKSFGFNNHVTTDTTLDERIDEWLQKSNAFEDAEQLAQELRNAGAHTTAEMFIKAVTKIARCGGYFTYGLYQGSPLYAAMHPQETFQALKKIPSVMKHLAPIALMLSMPDVFLMIEPLAKIHDICEHIGALEHMRNNPLTATIALLGDLAYVTKHVFVPAALERTRLIFYAFMQHAKQETTKFAKEASAEDWSKVAGNATAFFYTPFFFNPHKIVATVNELTNTGEVLSHYLALLGKHIAKSVNAEELIKDLENCGLEATYIEEILDHVDKAGRELGYVNPEIVASLKTKAILEEIQRLTTAGASVDKYLTDVGQKVGEFGFQGDKFVKRLEYEGLNEAQIITIMSEAYDIAKGKPNALIEKTPDFKNFKKIAEELGEFCAKKIREGKSIDLSIYKEFVGDFQILERGMHELIQEGAMKIEGPVTKILKESIKPGANVNNIKGSVYEIERALKFKKSGRPVDVLSYHFFNDPAIQKKYPKDFLDKLRKHYGNCEYDIKTGNIVVECKDINWSNLKPKDFENFQLHRELAEKFGFDYELYSKQRIPADAQQKLIDKSIKFFEE